MNRRTFISTAVVSLATLSVDADELLEIQNQSVKLDIRFPSQYTIYQTHDVLQRYTEEWVDTKRAIVELFSGSSTTDINLEKACGLITELDPVNMTAVMKILETPKGKEISQYDLNDYLISFMCMGEVDDNMGVASCLIVKASLIPKNLL